jgi:Na+-transporting NADH:ubiquinone oxidoreductase subunit B/electron transport complex protein RnfD
MILSHTALPKETLSLRTMLILTGALGIVLFAATIIFGWYVLAIAVVSYVFSFGVEYGVNKARKKPLDNGWMVTPLVFALLMPPTAPLWMVAIGSSFGTLFGKMLFGGLGKNLFNPALVGVLFITFAFPVLMNTEWLDPVTNIISSSTPISLLQAKGGSLGAFTYSQLLLGNVPGVLGETFRLGIIFLGITLIVLKVIDWKLTVSLLATVVVLNLIGMLLFPASNFKDPIASLLVGGLVFYSVFIVTDPVTAPYHPIAKVLYGVGVGTLTVIIRNFATWPEGLIFAVIIMNAVAPMLDTLKINERKPMEVAK